MCLRESDRVSIFAFHLSTWTDFELPYVILLGNLASQANDRNKWFCGLAVLVVCGHLKWGWLSQEINKSPLNTPIYRMIIS